MHFSTIAIHAGQGPDPVTGATIPPISVSTTFTQAAPGASKGYEYSRSDNPTRHAFEVCLARLEEGEACATFASGMAATAALLETLSPGDGVVLGHDVYGGTYRLLDQVFKRWGIEYTSAESAESGAYQQAISRLSRPRLLWIETPTNPLLDVLRISDLVTLAREHKMKVAVDNTFATPYLQRPIKFGADYVVHSTTKYIGGHSDVVGGAVIGKTAADLEPVRQIQNSAGAVPSPMDCYLLLRGIKTLAVRMECHCSNAQGVAEWLEQHRGVARVRYPGLFSHAGYAIAESQMKAFGGMVTADLQGDIETTKDFCSRLRIFSLAESLGGVESLCSHPASMTHASVPREIRERRGILDTTVRLSVGIEDVEDLVDDLACALDNL